MANISTYLAAIMSAIYGRDVRSSIHDAIREINTAQEQSINAGTAISDGDPAGGVYDHSYYINTNTNDLLECDGTTWHIVSNIEGNAITSITGPVKNPAYPLRDEYTIHFSKAPNLVYYVYNAKSIVSIILKETDVLTDTYEITYNDGTSDEFDVENGNGIVSFEKTSTVGPIDTYTITFGDGTDYEFEVTNGTTWHNGVDISGKAPASTGFTLTDEDCVTGDMYFNVSEGSVYVCDQGAEAGTQSYWSCKFVMSGGGGGSMYLYGLNDVDAGTVQHPRPNQILQFDNTLGRWMAKDGGSGHTMKPLPSSNPTEATVAAAINTAALDPYNDEVASLFGISKWTNVKVYRLMIESGIGHYGIGEWKDSIVGTPSLATERDTWGWFYHEALKKLGDLTKKGYDYSLSFKFQTNNNEVITLGGYILDDTTGCICIRFANYVIDVSLAKVAIDIEVVRNDISMVV